MDLSWSPADAAFESEVRAFLAEELTPALREAGRRMTSVYAPPRVSLAWQAILHRRGWAAPAWPVEHGGCDWSVVQHYIFAREKARAGAPPLSPMGIQMCGPALIGHGDARQKAHFLPRMLSGEDLWCQGYSEPNAGSDLASLQMSAVADGDGYRCNGSKIWTTHGHEANMMFCLVRTRQAARPQQGITFLLIDMTSPGISVRPIISLTGEHIQNEIFFEDVRVPAANVVGEVDHGWTVAKYLLEFERGGAAYAPGLQARLERIIAAARADGGGLMGEPGFAGRIAAIQVEVNALEATELRYMSALSLGRAAPGASSIQKLLGTELSQALTELALEAAGAYGSVFAPGLCAPGGPVTWPGGGPGGGLAAPDLIPREAAIAPLRYLNDRAGTIYAGSSEIQRNILAKAALCLG